MKNNNNIIIITIFNWDNVFTGWSMYLKKACVWLSQLPLIINNNNNTVLLIMMVVKRCMYSQCFSVKFTYELGISNNRLGKCFLSCLISRWEIMKTDMFLQYLPNYYFLYFLIYFYHIWICFIMIIVQIRTTCT